MTLWAHDIEMQRCYRRAVVVAQLVEQSLPKPEVHGLNPTIGEILLIIVYCQLYWKGKNKEKEAGNGPFLKKNVW